MEGITMKEIVKKAWAGTLESSDAYVEVEPAEAVEIELQSVVQAQFGDAIEAAVRAIRILIANDKA